MLGERFQGFISKKGMVLMRIDLVGAFKYAVLIVIEFVAYNINAYMEWANNH